MRVIEIREPNGKFIYTERSIPEPQFGEVRIKVEACGVCFTDKMVQDGTAPNVRYPVIPGQEVVGRIDAVGPDTRQHRGGHTPFQPGMRVGVGWHGGHCGLCRACHHGRHAMCEKLMSTGVNRDGGYAEYMIASVNSLVRIPDELSAVDAAPLLTAGTAAFNAIRRSGHEPPAIVGVFGLGGLGHLAVQMANKLGYYTVAISSDGSKRDIAHQLGARLYIDMSTQNAVQELQNMGGAQVILACSPHVERMSWLINGLSEDGTMMVLALSKERIGICPNDLVLKRRRICGWPSGTPTDVEDTLRFCAISGVRARVEKFPFDRIDDALRGMIEDKLHFRAVLMAP